MSIKKDYWDVRVDEWITRNTLIDPQYELFDIINNIPDIENKTICDLGVGTGRYLRCIKKYKFLYGIDFMEKNIDIANKLKPTNCELFVDDIVDLKFNIKVDIIYTCGSLLHIHPSQLELAIKNITNIGAPHILLREITNETFHNKDENDPNNYHWGHEYISLFNKFNYKLIYKNLCAKCPTSVNYTFHFIKN